MHRALPLLAALAVGLAYWALVGRWAGVAEPWDAPAYWRAAYPGCLVLAAIAGLVRRQDAWALGGLIAAAQLPVAMLSAGAGPLLAVGIGFTAIVSVPAMALAALAARLR